MEELTYKKYYTIFLQIAVIITIRSGLKLGHIRIYYEIKYRIYYINHKYFIYALLQSTIASLLASIYAHIHMSNLLSPAY